MFKKVLDWMVIFSFFLTIIGPMPHAHASMPTAAIRSVLGLPAPGTMVSLSAAYQPVIIKGLTVHKDNPFLFDFIVDVGQDRLSSGPLKKEGEKLIKYFLASLAIPDKDIWVNLSPYEKNKIVPEALGQTDMGRDLLEQDYILKQITASLIYPEKKLGKVFWDEVYAKAQKMYGTTQVPVNTFNKVWILADRAGIFERNQTAFVVDSHLKVMLEEDYLSWKKHAQVTHSLASDIIRSIILPQLEKEVNTGRNFATVRQILNSLILANWYKKNLKQALLNQIYTNQGKVKGIVLTDPGIKQRIYDQYLRAYKKGVFNYIKEDVSHGGPIARKYFSGGFGIGRGVASPAMITNPDVFYSSMANSGPLADFTMMALTSSSRGASAAMTAINLGLRDAAMRRDDNNDSSVKYPSIRSVLENAGFKEKKLTLEMASRYAESLVLRGLIDLKNDNPGITTEIREFYGTLDPGRIFETYNYNRIRNLRVVLKAIAKTPARKKDHYHYNEILKYAFILAIQDVYYLFPMKSPERDPVKPILRQFLEIFGDHKYEDLAGKNSVELFGLISSDITPNLLDILIHHYILPVIRTSSLGKQVPRFEAINFKNSRNEIIPEGQEKPDEALTKALRRYFHRKKVGVIQAEIELRELRVGRYAVGLKDRGYDSIEASADRHFDIKALENELNPPNPVGSLGDDEAMSTDPRKEMAEEALSRADSLGEIRKALGNLRPGTLVTQGDRDAMNRLSEESIREMKNAVRYGARDLHTLQMVASQYAGNSQVDGLLSKANQFLAEAPKHPEQEYQSRAQGIFIRVIQLMEPNLLLDSASQNGQASEAMTAPADGLKGILVPGGIDLNTSNGMRWTDAKAGAGVEMKFDQAMFQSTRPKDIDSLTPVIVNVTLLTNVWSLVGLEAPSF